ncbi:DNA-binding protein [Rhizobium leguminosarum bv. trifolii]|uniref:antitoxin n=1 Tax=Rhizobium leguminosarum TaxID=384 RepID=UPI000E2E993E|nr:AbrB/MazE/SpoVT family DNA-binding domain-containing protein [Rhizobium leguminosarum]RFB92593.1 DNA-binding protein [Rhizobium leguminosarum bv. trifolii]
MYHDSYRKVEAVRLPAEFRFEESEVFVRRDPKTGDVILSRKPESWDGLFELHGKDPIPDDFMGPADRRQPSCDRDPFEDRDVKDGNL